MPLPSKVIRFSWGLPRTIRAVFWRAAFLFVASPVCLVANSPMPSGNSQFSEATSQTTREVSPARMVQLPNYRPPWANSSNDAGIVPAETSLTDITLTLARPPEREKAFQQLLRDQQDPNSPDYHRWLTSTQIGDRFGRSENDITGITAWLQSQGLHVDWIAPSRIFIGFSGTAADINLAFRTELHYYKVKGEQRMSISSDPFIPEALAPVIKAVAGLYTLELRPQQHVSSIGSPQLTSSSGSHFIAPADFATIYDLPANLTGAGITIGIVGLSRTDFGDFDIFRTITGSSFLNPTEMVPPATDGGQDPGPAFNAPPATGVSTCNCTASTSDPTSCATSANAMVAYQREATLDVMRAGSIAPRANLLLVATCPGMNALDSLIPDLKYLTETEPVPAQIVTISYGGCEDSEESYYSMLDAMMSHAAMRGISVFVSSGDSGASGCDDHMEPPPPTPEPNSTNVLCASSYVTCVGGTEFNDAINSSLYWNKGNSSNFGSARSYIPEGAWNDPLTSGNVTQLRASGGGVSVLNTSTPPWQIGPGVPSAGSGRYTPDIAFAASSDHDGYMFCFAAQSESCTLSGNSDATWFVEGGTSAAAPDMAGIAALLDQRLGATGGLGNLNPRIYEMAVNVPSAFHPITIATSGVQYCNIDTPSMCNNSVPGPDSLTDGQAGYLLGTGGYSEVTGLGSLDVSQFIEHYSPSPSTSLPVLPTVDVAPSSSTTTTAQVLPVTVTIAGGSGDPTPTGSVTLTGGGYNSAATTLVSGSATINIPAGVLVAGTDTLTAAYKPDSTSSSTYSGASGTAVITVIFQPVLSALRFIPISPCRVADTRSEEGSFGGPEFIDNSTRQFFIPQNTTCNIPSTALAYSLNVTVVPTASLNYLTIWPTGDTQPYVSTLNSDGRIKANAAIVPAGANGGVSVYVTDATQVILDIDGYFVPASTSSALAFYPLTPCRIADTRGARGPLGGPSLNGGSVRAFPIPSSSCNIPSTAQAYSLNVTAVPRNTLNYLTIWATGQSQPDTSTLNSSTGAVVANAAIVPSGISGDVSVFVSDDSDVILDVNGYFAPPRTGGLSLYAIRPCRAIDTRPTHSAR